jgi:hypothetical protein
MVQSIIKDKNLYNNLGPIDLHLLYELTQSEKTCLLS